MGVFEMVVLIVLISTVGKILGRRSQRIEPRGDAPKLGPGEMEGIRESLDDLSGRIMRLEEERDFYKDLLESPDRQRGLPSAEKDGLP